MYFRLSARVLTFRVVLILFISAFVGWLFGYGLLIPLTTCLVLLFWNYRHLFKLIDWLWQSKAISPPQSDGLWGRVYDGLYHQIKRHRQKTKALNEKIRRFRDGAEALPDAALVLSDELAIQWGNKKAQRLLGIRWPGDVGQRIDNLLRAPEFAQYLEDGMFDAPCSLASPVNSDIQLEIRLMAYGNEHILLLARDISHIHRLGEMRRDFVANVSHELKTPLTVVRGYIEMIQSTEHVLEPHWQKAFSTIEGQVTRMDRLVEQLLNLSKIETHSDTDNKEIIDMPLLIHTLVDDVAWLNQNKGHTIEKCIDPIIGLIGIDTELKSACTNLLSNAITYTQAQGSIKVTWQKQGNKAKFVVKDNGPGIKPEDINRLTERFYRIDKSRSRDTGGSGLGLAIVKHVMHHHNAELIINSHWGSGTEFTLLFDEASLVDLCDEGSIN
jgi:two-component system phosphate regulon sensor histidine kinase PhoR